MKYRKYMGKHTRIWMVFLCFWFIQNAGAQWFAPTQEGIITLGTDTIHCPDINQGDTVVAVFYIANKGTQPVKIYQVHPGCQCTTPEFHDSLFPGQTDSIILVFYSKNHHEPTFLKDAIVLNNVQEKNYFVAGKMNKAGKTKNKKIRVTNALPLPKNTKIKNPKK